MKKGRLQHRVNLLYPDFYLDYVEVGRYVKIQFLGPSWEEAIGKVVEIIPSSIGGDELYRVKFEWGSDQFYSHNIELLPADYDYKTEHGLAVRELGEDYFA